MVRIIVQKDLLGQSAGKCYYEFAGLHNDSKQTTNVATGSTFLEVDTGDVYAYDETGATWHKICALGGAG